MYVRLRRRKEDSRMCLAVIIAGIALLALTSKAHAIDGSALSKGKNGYWHLVMPSELTQSMQDSVPAFVVAADSEYAKSVRKKYPYGEHQAPFALIKDLNLDGREDLYLDGREGDERRVYIAISEERSYRWIVAVREAAPGGLRASGLRWARHPSNTPWVELFPRSEESRQLFRWSDDGVEGLSIIAD